uniref:TIL domain-containing protein n=1 Tax=Gouania willdenowi TaxID=441366 RepID=A0A8C5G4K2_GOUWI
ILKLRKQPIFNVDLNCTLLPALACPPNSSYSLCTSSCPETCLGSVGPSGCEDVCVEGCKCNPGFILSDDKCVALKDCGCVDPSGVYHPVSQSLTCLSSVFSTESLLAEMWSTND